VDFAYIYLSCACVFLSVLFPQVRPCDRACGEHDMLRTGEFRAISCRGEQGCMDPKPNFSSGETDFLWGM
jgi:hypothetical protein